MAPTVITPTPGRVLWYYPPGVVPAPGVQPLAAHVAYVWDDTRVNLMVIDRTGDASPRTSVLLVQPGATPPAGGDYCCWMPYQIGAAQRHPAA